MTPKTKKKKDNIISILLLGGGLAWWLSSRKTVTPPSTRSIPASSIWTAVRDFGYPSGTWEELIAGNGNLAYGGPLGVPPAWRVGGYQFFSASTPADRWQRLERSAIFFDTSSILEDVSKIKSARLVIDAGTRYDGLGVSPSVGIYPCSPVNSAELIESDYESAFLSSTELAPVCSYSNFTGTVTFALNQSGINWIAPGGITIFGFRNANYDVAGVAPTWTPGKFCSMYGRSYVLEITI